MIYHLKVTVSSDLGILKNSSLKISYYYFSGILKVQKSFAFAILLKSKQSSKLLVNFDLGFKEELY
jgi:hypothetical protein